MTPENKSGMLCRSGYRGVLHTSFWGDRDLPIPAEEPEAEHKQDINKQI